MKEAAEYREHAAQCRNLAAQMGTREHRRLVLEMAHVWETMADEREGTWSRGRGLHRRLG